MENATKGLAEQLVTLMTNHVDHMVHNRLGIVSTAPNPVGVVWKPATTKKDADGRVIAYELRQAPGRGKKLRTVREPIGVVGADNKIVGVTGAAIAGAPRLQAPGIFPEVAEFLWRRILDLYKLDQEFVARLASWAYREKNRDMKVLLAAFLLVQNRVGAPVMDGGKVAFYDSDYRAVGEAMLLLYEAEHALRPKDLVRVYDLLSLPAIAALNREVFLPTAGKRRPLGRYEDTVTRWLAHREANPSLLQGLVKASMAGTVRRLTRIVRYRPTSHAYFAKLGWRQKQAKDGRRQIGIGAEVQKDTWAGLSEAEVCARIGRERPAYKRLTVLVPPEVGLTRAVMAAAIEAGCIGPMDMMILTPTLEAHGLLNIASIKARWEAALAASVAAESQRAAHVARNVKSAELAEKLTATADASMAKAVEEVIKDVELYVFIDISSSMNDALPKAKDLVTQLLGGVPLERVHMAIFNTVGRETKIPAASRKGVEQALLGVTANGGTAYKSGVEALKHVRPKDGADVIFLFIGDEEGEDGNDLAAAVRRTGFAPTAFGLLPCGNHNGRTVQHAARALGVPCIEIAASTFNDAYAVPRTLKALIAATPVGAPTRQVAAPRMTLVDTILKTELLRRPAWASR